jgi:putative peptide zinc metalloprotease protein
LSPVRKLIQFLSKQQTVTNRRLCVVGGAGLALLALVAFFLTRPSTIRTCGIVEYSPPTIVRSASPGFVKQVLVENGETVHTGQVLIAMENDELRVELANVRNQLEQSRLQQRIHRQAEETAKEQAELANFQSLEKKEREINAQVDGLVVRAPTDGQVVAHELDTMPGRYLAVGDEIAVIGNEKDKEIILAAAQNDISSFVAQRKRPVTIRVTGDEGNSFTAELTKIDPRASTSLPHPALGADAGGPLPVTPRRDAKDSKDSKKPASELLDPCFSGTVQLDQAESLRLRTGQRVTVLFNSSEQSWAGNLVMRVQKWIDDRLASTNR